ncbi:hypothetical protein [Bradyrhizobium sp. NBAIM01]|uniref:hypothetical protein n=1 Tax=Bradyrhizobium sp. NBAIM01 TaxID=2793818 RepID=UPI001CD1A67C|nr:hypothetical protein [Bradyrhizobium sp. NBAIM01]
MILHALRAHDVDRACNLLFRQIQAIEWFSLSLSERETNLVGPLHSDETLGRGRSPLAAASTIEAQDLTILMKSAQTP